MGSQQLFSLIDYPKKDLMNLLRAADSNSFNLRHDQSSAVALMFFEASTRTKISFERACQEINRPFLNIDLENSSLSKGESIDETLEVIADYGVSTLVLRSKDPIVMEAAINSNLNVVSAGQDTRFHPTQALGDLLALKKYWKIESFDEFKGKALLIVGDLVHSRVAHSWAELASILGIRLLLSAPSQWRARGLEEGGEYVESLKEAVPQADAIMSLRVQKERHVDASSSFDLFVKNFQLSEKMLNSKPLLHPGPINWGIELNLALKSYKNSLVSLQRQQCFRVRAEILKQL